MKKLISILCLFLSIIFVGCETPIKEYNGTKINTLIYRTVDYFGGSTVTYEFDFIENKATKQKNNLIEDAFLIQDLSTFTDEQEKTFIDKCYSYGLFSIKDYYENENVDDGGGWNLVIEYDDGIKKESHGKNACPDKVFSKCSYAFYDLCGEGVLAHINDSK